MDYVINILIAILLGALVLFLLHLVVYDLLSINLIYFVYLLVKRELWHFIAKRRLVNGDLVFISYRGKLRKAYIKYVSLAGNTVSLKFDETELNTKETEHNSYHLSRIKIPEHYSKATKVLYSGEED